MALVDYWIEFPPAHVLLRALVGWKKKRPSAEPAMTKTESVLEGLATQGDPTRGLAPKKKLSQLPASVQNFIRDAREEISKHANG